MARTARQMPEFPLQAALAVACAVYRVQGQVKFNEPYQDVTGQYFGAADIVKHTLTGKMQFNVTDDDREAAATLAESINSSITFSLIQGQKVNDFTRNVCDLVSKETVKLFEIGLLVWAPQLMDSMNYRQRQRVEIIDNSYNSDPLGKIGDKVTIDFTLIRHNYVQSLNCYSALGHDGNGHAVGFLTQKESLLKSGKLTGKIRKFERNRYNNGVMTTTLNYVKEAN